MSERSFDLPRQIDRLCAALAKYYEVSGDSLLQRLVVNARCEIQEGVDYDRWDGGQYGHGVTMLVPSSIFYSVFDKLDDVERGLAENLNRLARIPNEHVSWVRVQLSEDESIANWREDSGQLLRPGPLTSARSEGDITRIWGEASYLRVFISHKDAHKILATNVKEVLSRLGVSSFVAHEDIAPTTEWQEQIEIALFSMHVLVAFLTPDFHDSSWTDQEVGIAIGRGVPVFAVRLGKDPYGFIGKYQGISPGPRHAAAWAEDIVRLALGHAQLSPTMQEGLVTRFENATSWNDANQLMDFLDDHLKTAEPAIINRLEAAPSLNGELRGAFRVQSKLKGLIARLRGQ